MATTGGTLEQLLSGLERAVAAAEGAKSALLASPDPAAELRSGALGAELVRLHAFALDAAFESLLAVSKLTGRVEALKARAVAVGAKWPPEVAAVIEVEKEAKRGRQVG